MRRPFSIASFGTVVCVAACGGSAARVADDAQSSAGTAGSVARGGLGGAPDSIGGAGGRTVAGASAALGGAGTSGASNQSGASGVSGGSSPTGGSSASGGASGRTSDAGGSSIDGTVPNPGVASACSATGADWCAVLSGGSLLEYTSAIARDPQGNLLILGRTQGGLVGSGRGGFDVFIAKYTSNGQLLWVRQYGSELSEIPGGLAVDSHGDILYGYRQTLSDDVTIAGFLAKLSSTGDPLWTRQLGTDIPGVAVDDDGNVFFAASNYADPLLAKYSPSGEMLWSKPNFSGDITVNAAGGAVVTIARPGQDSTVGMISADGDLLWSDANAPFQASAYAVDASSNVFAVGTAAVRRYSDTGALVWEAALDHNLFDVNDIAVDARGHVFVIGMANDFGKPYFRAYVAKYSQDGAPQGGQELGVEGDFEGFLTVAVDDSQLFITGPYRSGVFIAHMSLL